MAVLFLKELYTNFAMFFKLCVLMWVCVYGILCEDAVIRAIFKSCLSLKLEHIKTIFEDVDHFVENGEFPADREKCIIKCAFRYSDLFDSDSVINEEKLKKVRNTAKSFKKLLGVLSDTALDLCRHAEGSDECEKAYNLAKCAVDLARKKTDSTTHMTTESEPERSTANKFIEHDRVVHKSSATKAQSPYSLHFVGLFLSTFLLINTITA